MPEQEHNESAPVLLQCEQGIATLTLNRPESLNALNPEMALALEKITAELIQDQSVRCLIIRGAAGQFMAGGDVGYFYQSLSQSKEQVSAVMNGVFKAVNGFILNLRAMPQPVIASVEGSAAGFGISLLCACDLAIASSEAQFSLAYRHIGATPDGGVSWFLPRLIGLKRSMELVLLGERFDASRAEQIGLINRVVETAQLATATQQLASQIAQGPAQTLADSKQLIYASLGHSLQVHVKHEQAAFIQAMGREEFSEGVSAFCEKRKANFPKSS